MANCLFLEKEITPIFISSGRHGPAIPTYTTRGNPRKREQRFGKIQGEQQEQNRRREERNTYPSLGGAAAQARLPQGLPIQKLLRRQDGHRRRRRPSGLGQGAGGRRHAQVVGVGQGALAEVGREGGAGQREALRAQAAQHGGRPGPAQPRQHGQRHAQHQERREQRQRQHQVELQLGRRRRRLGARRPLAQLRQRLLQALGQHHVQRGRGRQRRLPVVLHHGHQPLLGRVPLAHGARRAHLAAVQPHAEQRRLRRLHQLVGQPRVAPRVRVHRHHLGHQVAGLGRARNHLERRRRRRPSRTLSRRRRRRGPEHPGRVVVASKERCAYSAPLRASTDTSGAAPAAPALPPASQ
ncbi:uncharacterized protein [Agelaius tricolor]|uniref:uncharacterized protein n=1 Tax=Agelaius tricolor TaxID=9191 RepID=UPI0039F250CF